MGLKFVAPILHDEIIEFEQQISKFIFDSSDLCNELVEIIKRISKDIDSSLTVNTSL
jgi:hypothetical protein